MGKLVHKMFEEKEAEGARKERLRIVRNMTGKYSDEQIAKVMGLSLSEVEQLAKDCAHC